MHPSLNEKRELAHKEEGSLISLWHGVSIFTGEQGCLTVLEEVRILFKDALED